MSATTTIGEAIKISGNRSTYWAFIAIWFGWGLPGYAVLDGRHVEWLGLGLGSALTTAYAVVFGVLYFVLARRWTQSIDDAVEREAQWAPLPTFGILAALPYVFGLIFPFVD